MALSAAAAWTQSADDNMISDVRYTVDTGDSGTHTHTHTQPFYGPISGTTRVSRCQKRTSGLYGAREA